MVPRLTVNSHTYLVDRKQIPQKSQSAKAIHVLAARLRRTRKAYGLNQHQLARRAGIAPSTLFCLESQCTEDLQLSTLLKLCRELHCTPDYLLGFPPREETSTPRLTSPSGKA
jgi:DNA-binding Xre family transcriptional regulator